MLLLAGCGADDLTVNFRGRYISNIEMPGGKIVYVPMKPPKAGMTETRSAGEWAIDFDILEKSVTPRTKMLVINTPRELLSAPVPPFPRQPGTLLLTRACVV